MESSSKEPPSEADQPEEEHPAKSDSSTQPIKISRLLRTEFDAKYQIVNLQTPLNAFMSGHYKQSFAFHTLRSRLPVVLTNVIDTLTRDKTELVAQFGMLIPTSVFGHLLYLFAFQPPMNSHRLPARS